ncbi:L-fucose:H(+) symporter [Vibrio crassostreae]|nr:L-fucose:H+ symporter permease [Vibrio crassostreae]TCO05887.1 FHS family L-fucose permease-like MFS transporter [Vibrio crassostreae]TCT50243.1 FHS family L-fucose permease-like MFS transporter [Vibrio crassostreae]TCT65089.1 FHS family L-fucose permease-like MFS transporter [Vibrio crassostreae]TCT75309.1 FHS family L-fucose permease-like MFS transporter [Vibrio crassostreae]TCT94266.1 FHS family L-fucose permease-like MFS transporter [Vibrio crassostreae]
MSDTLNISSSETQRNNKVEVIPKEIKFAFWLLCCCFAMWGLANNMTDVLIAQFRKVFTLTDMQSGLVQTAFYGAYFCLALPAALFIQRYSYKAGVLLGLGLFATGALLFYPAAQAMEYLPFLLALFVLAGGLSILETSANPYILAMGPEETATRRLNIAQACNPIGSITGVLIGKFYILSQLNPATDSERAAMAADELAKIQSDELYAVMMPYMGVAVVIALIWLLILKTKMPAAKDTSTTGESTFGQAYRRIVKRSHFTKGVLAQFFYVGAQIGCWSWTIRYVMQEVGGTEAEASTYLLTSIVIFSVMRWVCVALMKHIEPQKLLAALAAIAAILVAVIMAVGGLAGAYALVGVSACMSLMFPTIFGLSLRDLGSDSKFGGSFLIMAILGGALLTAIMGQISDAAGIGAAFVIPFIGFVYLVYYGAKGYQVK